MKYTADVIKLSEKRDKEVTKLFEDYKKAKKEEVVEENLADIVK